MIPFLENFSLLQGIALALAIQMLFIVLLIYRQNRQYRNNEQVEEKLQALYQEFQQAFQANQYSIHEKITQGQLANQRLISEIIQGQMTDVREQMNHSFKQHTSALTSHLHSLTEEIRNHLHNLTQQVNHKLSEGFEKTSSTFTDVVRRLTIIDEAQKKITELSTHVVSLQDVLVDKKARGAFGEVQLSSLIANMIPPSHYQMQYTLHQI